MPETTPVSVLTGPIDGAALELWLAAPEQARTAVLVNRDGGPVVDHPRVATFADSVRHLMGGCLCCGPPGALTRALRAMLPRARLGEIDRVVVVAGDVARVVAALAGDPVVAAVYRPAGTVDALTFSGLVV